MSDVAEEKTLCRELRAVLAELDDERIRVSSAGICETVTSSDVWRESDLSGSPASFRSKAALCGTHPHIAGRVGYE